MSCNDPLDAALLADYWLAGLASRDEDAVEEHLLACDACGDRLRDVIALIEGVRELAREGSLQMVVSDAFLRRAADEGCGSANTPLPREAACSAPSRQTTTFSSAVWPRISVGQAAST
jgi:hypothetical protein